MFNPQAEFYFEIFISNLIDNVKVMVTSFKMYSHEDATVLWSKTQGRTFVKQHSQLQITEQFAFLKGVISHLQSSLPLRITFFVYCILISFS